MVTRRASRQTRPLKAFALAAIIGGLIGTFAGLTSGISAADFSKAVDTEVLGRLQAAAVLPNGTAPDVLKSIREATVLIEAAGCDGQSTGTGVVIADGRVLTNRHVLAGTSGARVTNLNGTSAGADRMSASSIDDAAVISLPDHQSAPFGSGIKPDAQKGPHEGQTIIVAGHPLGGPLVIQGGTVLNTDDGTPYGTGGTVWHTNVPVASGSSGSGVFTADGELIGLVFSRDNATGNAVVIPASRLMAWSLYGSTPWESCDKRHPGARLN